MRTRSFGNGIWLVAILGIGGWGCTVTSGGSGGASGSGGSMGSGSGGSANGSGGATGSGGSATGSGGATAGSGGAIATCSSQGSPPADPPAGSTKGPCDIFKDDGGPCVAAHSTARALYASYDGPLYEVKKTDGTVHDIHPLSPGGLADSADQDTFCDVNSCTISKIYDQSGKGNHLTKAPAGMAKMTPDNEANAKSAPATFGGHKVYGVHIVNGVGYRNNTPCGTATGDAPETEYMVVAGAVYNPACCFDYGNMETTSRDDGEGTMEAVYFGNCTVWNKGADMGPWVMGDLENGLWAGDVSPYNANTPVTFAYVTGMVKGDSTSASNMNGHWTIKVGDAQSGMLTTPFDGKRPSSRYNPMKKEGAVGLGTGGDNSDGAKGDWFEGVMTSAYSSNMADDLVQMNIVSVYGAQ